MAFDFPMRAELDDPLLGFRFAVFFMGVTGPAFPLDFRFQSVEGLGQGITVERLGDQAALNPRQYPSGRAENQLELKRGMPRISTYRMEVLKSFEEYKFKPRNVMVSILDENGIPFSTWLLREAYPTKWSISGLDATANQVVIENLSLTYVSAEAFSL